MKGIQTTERLLVHPDDANLPPEEQTRFYLEPPTPKLEAHISDMTRVVQTSEGVAISNRSAQAGLEYLLGCLARVENLQDMTGQPITVPTAPHPMAPEGRARVTEAGLMAIPRHVRKWLAEKIAEELKVSEAEKGES